MASLVYEWENCCDDTVQVKYIIFFFLVFFFYLIVRGGHCYNTGVRNTHSTNELVLFDM